MYYNITNACTYNQHVIKGSFDEYTPWNKRESIEVHMKVQ
jgi:hypothetical protein